MHHQRYWRTRRKRVLGRSRHGTGPQGIYSISGWTRNGKTLYGHQFRSHYTRIQNGDGIHGHGVSTTQGHRGSQCLSTRIWYSSRRYDQKQKHVRNHDARIDWSYAWRIAIRCWYCSGQAFWSKCCWYPSQGIGLRFGCREIECGLYPFQTSRGTQKGWPRRRRPRSLGGRSIWCRRKGMGIDGFANFHWSLGYSHGYCQNDGTGRCGTVHGVYGNRTSRCRVQGD
mmetsp:Transcript_9687/g.18533  ORF Transcript_9687/g.18533 Transcript_9687/m.18533 type:complete len:226 (+) Transcript_9687:1217-1894(+)